MEIFDNAAKYFMIMNKKNHPSYIGVQQEPVSINPFEESKLSIEDSNFKEKVIGQDSTSATRFIFTRNQSADDSCLYAKAKLVDSRKKKGHNQTMKESNKEPTVTRIW